MRAALRFLRDEHGGDLGEFCLFAALVAIAITVVALTVEPVANELCGLLRRILR